MTPHNHNVSPSPNDPFDLWLQMVNRMIIAPTASLLRLLWRILTSLGDETRRRRPEVRRRYGARRGRRS